MKQIQLKKKKKNLDGCIVAAKAIHYVVEVIWNGIQIKSRHVGIISFSFNYS